MNSSKALQLNLVDWKKIGRFGVVAGAGAGVAFLSSVAGMDWGSWSPIVTAAAGVAIEALRRWIADNQ